MAYKKYYLYKEQYSIDNGETWLDVEPLTLLPNGTAIDTYETEADCEGQPTPTGDTKYIAYYSNGTSYAQACDSTSAITQGEITLSNLVSLEIGSCVTSIGASAVRDCTTLTSVTIPDSVTTIGRVAFNGCYNLTHLIIPDSVTSIGEYAFGYCTRLQDITMLRTTPPTLAAGGVFNNTNNCPIYVPCGSVDFYQNANVWSANYKYRIYPWIECGSGEAQYRWYPSGTTCVGYDKWEQSIRQVSYDSGTTWNNIIPTEYSATTLIEVDSEDCGYVPPTPPTPTSNTKFLANYSDGTSYSALCTSSSALTSGETRPTGYVYSAMTSCTIGDCVTSIGSKALQYCYSLSSCTIGSGVTSISDRAFMNCYSVSSIDIPNSVTSIDEYVFYFCSGMTSVTIPNSVTSVGEYAFENCYSLSSIDIPNSVTSIGIGAFDSCSGMTSCRIGSGITSISSKSFYYCISLASVTIPNNVTSIGNQSFYVCSGLTSVTIPNSVTSIGSEAFYLCHALSSIDIPNSVTSIGSEAFSRCYSLTSVTIGSGVTSIGNDAFAYCSGLTSITVNATTPPRLGTTVFYSTNNAPIYVPSASVNTYKSASGWSGYSSRIQAIP